MTEELKPVKPADNFEITPGKSIIEKVIDYSTATRIKLWQGATHDLSIHDEKSISSLRQ